MSRAFETSCECCRPKAARDQLMRERRRFNEPAAPVDLTAVKAMLVDALKATSDNPENIDLIENEVINGDRDNLYFDWVGIDLDKLSNTVTGFYADYYYRLAIREHTLFGQLGQFREAVAEAFVPITAWWNKLATMVAAWFAAREGRG